MRVIAPLSYNRKFLLDRYQPKDIVVKVVGISSVGKRCFVALFMTPDAAPLLLQIKGAHNSVLEPYAGKSEHHQHGELAAVGQRLTQSSSDFFLGWVCGPKWKDFYMRQLRDMKVLFLVQDITPTRLRRYVVFCGQALTRSHAKFGNAALISGYLGKSDVFDEAVSMFAMEYAEQNRRDYEGVAVGSQNRKDSYCLGPAQKKRLEPKNRNVGK